MARKRKVIHAVEYVRRLGGGSQSKLFGCSDGEYYVVKFQNNPHGVRVLANEILATLLAKQLGLPVPEVALIHVDRDLIRRNEECVIQEIDRSYYCQSGLCFGSRAPSYRDPLHNCRLHEVYDIVPYHRFPVSVNKFEFVGMLVFDKWTDNCDSRQAIFFRDGGQLEYRVLMIDHGFCFNGSKWTFYNRAKHGLCNFRGVYEEVKGMEAFDYWIARLHRKINEEVLMEAVEAIPPEWYEHDKNSILNLVQELDKRREYVRDLLWSAVVEFPTFFPNWEYDIAHPGAEAAD